MNFSKRLLITLAILAILLLIAFFVFNSKFVVKAQNQIKIFPVSYSLESSGEVIWQNPQNAFNQDLPDNASFSDFNEENSAFIQENIKEQTTTTTVPSETTPITESTTTTLPSEMTTTTTEQPTTTTVESTTTTTIESTTTTTTLPLEETTTTTIPQETTTTEPISWLKKIFGFLIPKVNAEEEKQTLNSASLIFENFSLPEDFDLNKIQNVQLRISLAGQPREMAASPISQGRGQEGDKVIISYFYQNEWRNLEELDLSQEISNNTNGGYFLYALPIFENPEDLQNLKIKFTYYATSIISDSKLSPVYLDSVWLDLEYGKVIKIESKIGKHDWKISEEPEFELPETHTTFFSKIKSTLGIDNLEVSLVIPDGTETQEGIIIQGNKIKITKLGNSNFKPGLYKLRIKKGGQISIQEFTWGVLAINTNKSIYLPNEIAYLQMAVLKDDGHTVCDASLKLEITNSSFQTTILSTADGTVKYSDTCGPNNVTDIPDYFAYYTVNGPGRYEIMLTNLDNGYEINDSFEVRDSVPFEIERIGPTRIYPPATYEMKLKIKANQDFKGQVSEQVPSSFDISIQDTRYTIQDTNQDQKSIIWQVDLKAGETYNFSYQFDAPDISPYIYLLGPLKVGDFQEMRQWQIASDAVTTYDFSLCGSTCDTSTDWQAFADDVDVFRFAGSTANRNTHIEATDAQYTAISSSNDSRWTSANPGTGDEILFWSEMKINEDPSTISNIDLVWEGYLTGGASATFSMWVLTSGAAYQTDASWTQVGTNQSISGTTDTTMTRSITSNFSNYIDANGRLTWVVYESVSAQSLNTDYVKAVVTYTPPNITVGTTGTQTSFMSIPSTDNYVDGAFTFVRNTGSANVTEIIITDDGTVSANADLSNLKIRYETAGTCTYDGTETLFNSTGVAFNGSEQATATGTMSVGTSQVCVYVILDVGSGASANETVEIQISNPSTEITVSAGTVSPATTVAIADTTTLQAVISVNNVQLNSQSVINLIENTTQSVSATADISHPTDCNLITSVTAKIYRSEVTNGKDCTPDNNNCYSVASCTENTCSGTDATYTCTINMQFHADPTDGSAEYWRAWVEATDGSLSHSTTSPADAPDVITLRALNVTGSINYGTLDPGQNTTSTNQQITVTNTGNSAIDVRLYGAVMTWNGNTIDTANQEYSLSAFTYGAGNDLKESPGDDVNADLPKPTQSPSNSSDIFYWGLNVPSPMPSGGPYQGANTFEAITATGGEWVLNETNCNALSGWHWYTTNDRSACWSKTLADSVSWNKGVGDVSVLTGSYTCTSLGTYDLQTRMIAVAAGEWYKIVSNVDGTIITSSHNGSAGYSVISALAISDCIDGTKDLSDCGGSCTDWSTTNTWLRTWAGASGKSALPYLATDAGTNQTDNDYWDACTQHSEQDTPLGCTDNFYLNRKVCSDGDTNYSWAAACGDSSGSNWDSGARELGYSSCGYQSYFYTSYTDSSDSFRVVVRP